MKKRTLSDYQLEHDPRFIARMEAARQSLASGRGVPIEEVRTQLGIDAKPRRATGKRPKSKRAK